VFIVARARAFSFSFNRHKSIEYFIARTIPALNVRQTSGKTTQHTRIIIIRTLCVYGDTVMSLIRIVTLNNLPAFEYRQ